MTTQLRLISVGQRPTKSALVADGRKPVGQRIDGGDRRPWRLDSRTRAIGRRGVALARQELERARPSIPDRPLEQRRAG